MPKAKRPRRKPDLADRLCGAVKHLTAERASRTYVTQWIMLHTVAQHLGIADEQAQQAVALGVERGRLETDGGDEPQSVSLILGVGQIRMITPRQHNVGECGALANCLRNDLPAAPLDG